MRPKSVSAHRKGGQLYLAISCILHEIFQDGDLEAHQGLGMGSVPEGLKTQCLELVPNIPALELGRSEHAWQTPAHNESLGPCSWSHIWGSLDPYRPARERRWPHMGPLHPCDRGPKEKLLFLIQGLFSITYSSKIAWHFCIFHY